MSNIKIDAKSFQMGFDCAYDEVELTKEEIHNVWLHTEGRIAGLDDAGKTGDFPLAYTQAIIELLQLKQKAQTK